MMSVSPGSAPSPVVQRPLPPWADPSRTHGNNFDFIRFVLAILVVFSHSFPLLGRAADEPLTRWMPGYTLGGLAVDGFFILSGYLITQSWHARPELGPFLLKRVRRIYPAFVAMMLVLAVCVVPLVQQGPKAMWRGVRIQQWFSTTLTLGPYIRTDSFLGLPQKFVINGSTWTIRFEFACYLVLAAGMMLGILRRRWAALGVLAAATLTWAAMWRAGWSGGRFDASSLSTAIAQVTGWRPHWDGKIDLGTAELGRLGGTRFLVTFLAGAVFFTFRAVVPRQGWIALLCLASWAAIGSRGNAAPFLATALLLPYVFFYLAFGLAPRLSRFARYGDFSYGTYLYAWPIQQLLIARWPDLTPILLFALATPLSVVMGAASWHVVEKHFIHRRHRPRGDGH